MAFDAGVEREPSQLEKDLCAAKELILRYGWTQRDMGNTQKGFCVLGALMCAIAGNTICAIPLREDQLRYENATLAMQNAGGPWSMMGSVPSQNDMPGTTKQMVLEWFDRTIARVRGEAPSSWRAEPPVFPTVPGCTCPQCKPNWGQIADFGAMSFKDYDKAYAKTLVGV